jgi:hypothetical protein
MAFDEKIQVLSLKNSTGEANIKSIQLIFIKDKSANVKLLCRQCTRSGLDRKYRNKNA